MRQRVRDRTTSTNMICSSGGGCVCVDGGGRAAKATWRRAQGAIPQLGEHTGMRTLSRILCRLPRPSPPWANREAVLPKNVSAPVNSTVPSTYRFQQERAGP